MILYLHLPILHTPLQHSVPAPHDVPVVLHGGGEQTFALQMPLQQSLAATTRFCYLICNRPSGRRLAVASSDQ